MRFNCKSKREKAREKVQKEVEEILFMMNWHPCFAFFPVRLNSGKCAWLETVYRRYNIYDWVDRFLDPEYVGIENGKRRREIEIVKDDIDVFDARPKN